MNTAAIDIGTVGRSGVSTARVALLETKYELLKLVRLPAYLVPTLTFPVLFYLLFGVMFGRTQIVGGTTMSTYLMATYGVFGVIGASLFGLGVGVATERGQGWLLLKRATPMPVLATFLAKFAMAALFSIVIFVLMAAVSVLLGGVDLSAPTWLRLGAAVITGAVPACAMGLALGFLAGPNSAVPIVNLIYLPLSFASGLWLPIQALPRAVQDAAVFLPPYHHAQLALATFGADRGGPAWGHVLSLIGFTLFFMGVGYFGYRRDEGKTFG